MIYAAGYPNVHTIVLLYIGIHMYKNIDICSSIKVKTVFTFKFVGKNLYKVNWSLFTEHGEEAL